MFAKYYDLTIDLNIFYGYNLKKRCKQMAFYEFTRDKDYNVDIIETVGCIPHFHSAIEIVFVEKGDIDVNFNGSFINLKKGEILVNNSYDIHAYTTNAKSLAKVIIIPKSLLKDYFSGIKNRKFKNNIIKSQICFNQLSNLFSIMEYYKQSQNSLILTNLSQSAFNIAANYLALSDNPVEKDIIKEVLFYIYDNFTEDINLKNISTKFGYTPNHFSYIFNSYMRISLSNFINNLRTEKSAELIKNGTSIIEAAENSGFQSLRTFYRCFKGRYGTPPKEYKQGSLENTL